MKYKREYNNGHNITTIIFINCVLLLFFINDCYGTFCSNNKEYCEVCVKDNNEEYFGNVIIKRSRITTREKKLYIKMDIHDCMGSARIKSWIDWNNDKIFGNANDRDDDKNDDFFFDSGIISFCKPRMESIEKTHVTTLSFTKNIPSTVDINSTIITVRILLGETKIWNGFLFIEQDPSLIFQGDVCQKIWEIGDIKDIRFDMNYKTEFGTYI